MKEGREEGREGGREGGRNGGRKEGKKEEEGREELKEERRKEGREEGRVGATDLGAPDLAVVTLAGVALVFPPRAVPVDASVVFTGLGRRQLADHWAKRTHNGNVLSLSKANTQWKLSCH